MADASDILQVLSVISAAFPNFQERQNTPEIYLQLLGDLSAQELKAATLACCGEPGRAFAPSVGELRGAVMEIRRQVRGIPSPLEAWGEVRDALASGQEKFTNPMIQKVVDLLGFRYLRMSEEIMADRAHFLKEYERLIHEQMRLDVQLPQVTSYVQGQQMNLLELNSEIEKQELMSGQEVDDPADPGDTIYVPMPDYVRERLQRFTKKKAFQ